MTGTATGSGVFVAFEGGEGAGKSSVAAAVASHLRQAGFEVTVTREPGGTVLADTLREHVLTSDDMTPTTELLAFLTARADHVARVIKPALTVGQVVIVDRFHDSTLVYQGVARGHGTARVDRLSRWAAGDTMPDLTVLLDVDPAVGLNRASNGNRMEAEGYAFHQVTTSAFRQIAMERDDTHVLIDAGQPLDAVIEQATAAVLTHVSAVRSIEGR